MKREDIEKAAAEFPWMHMDNIDFAIQQVNAALEEVVDLFREKNYDFTVGDIRALKICNAQRFTPTTTMIIIAHHEHIGQAKHIKKQINAPKIP